MPIQKIITCDICGADGICYPSFFELENVNEGLAEPTGTGPMMKRAAPELKVSTKGVLRSQLIICLCREHFNSLEAACANWFAEVQDH